MTTHSWLLFLSSLLLPAPDLPVVSANDACEDAVSVTELPLMGSVPKVEVFGIKLYWKTCCQHPPL
jgi:hypothetical protein